MTIPVIRDRFLIVRPNSVVLKTNGLYVPCALCIEKRTKKRGNEDNGRARHIGRVSGARETAVVAVHMKRTLVEIQSVRKRRLGEEVAEVENDSRW